MVRNDLTIQDTADVEVIKNRIYEVRGLRVMLDRDLAELYGVETGVLNQAVRRNIREAAEKEIGKSIVSPLNAKQIAQGETILNIKGNEE